MVGCLLGLGLGVAMLLALMLLVSPLLRHAVDQTTIRATQQELDAVARDLRPLLVNRQDRDLIAALDGLRMRQPGWLRIELVDGRGQSWFPTQAQAPLAAPAVVTIQHDIPLQDRAMARLTVSRDVSQARADAQTLAWGFLPMAAATVAVGLVLVAIFLDWALGRRKGMAHSEARLAAEAGMRAKSDFLSMMSHEILTPLNGILGMAQMLLTPNVKEMEQQNYARTILTSGHTLLALLNDVLDFSKTGTGEFRLKVGVFEPEQLMRETQTLFAGAARDKSLQLEYHWSGPPGMRYQADSRRVRQMLFKLVGNGIKFTAQGHVHIEGSEIEREGDSVVLEFVVRDTGCGIAAAQVHRLFQPFSQADNSTAREFGGAGLGLSIVRDLAKAMGGSVGVRSEPEGGAHFWFRIRAGVVPVGEESRDAPRLAADLGGPAPRLVQLCGRVLVVEDNSINRQVIAAMLAKLGVAVALARDGQEAVDAIARAEELPQAVLMDCHMPVLDGWDATRRIRQWEAEVGNAHLPIIALTADSLAAGREACMAAGMDDFLHKPVALDALVQALERWLPPVSRPTPGTTAAAIDPHLFAALVDEMIPLLAQNKYDALTRFNDLQMLAAGTELAVEVEEVGRTLRAFRFDVALDQLRSMAATHKENSRR